MKTYAVIDSSFHEGLNRRLDELGTHFLSLFDGTSEHALVEIAPLLIPLDAASERARTLVLQLGSLHPCLTWLCSEVEPLALAKRLTRWHTVRIEDGGTLLLRWYDTRVQAALLELLDEGQREMFFNGVDRWAYCDRFGNWCSPVLRRAPDPAGLVGDSMELSQTQFAALLDASQPDVVLSHLTEVLPDETRRCDPIALYVLVQEQVRMASRLGWEGLDDQTQFLLPSLYTSGKAAEHPEFLQLMTAPAGEGIGTALSDRVEQLGDAVWSCGHPLWETAPRQDTALHPITNLEFPKC